MAEAKWLLENYPGNEDIQFLVPELEKRNIQYNILPNSLNVSPDDISFGQDECVIFHGSLVTSNWLKRRYQWVPGVYCDPDNLKCSVYYSHWGDYLLNQDYFMMPLYELYNKMSAIFRMCKNGCMFIRPDSGYKTFTGGLYDMTRLSSEINLLGDINCSSIDRIIAIISTPKEIESEWRVVIADSKTVSASLYMENGVFKTGKGCPPDVLGFAEQIAKEPWQPELCYVIDICRHKGILYLLEANSFSCSGLYECDMANIVESVSHAAVKEWNEYQECNN